uniref:Helix-turn-helix domain of transposase family ISL3 n=1 Tax=Candidatus Kentrum sp. TC TaxID=2126339 RepID=A0A450ZB94_9GAMM|nr:MAG: Helix-turn-helix domain of transposase family ISL3 [Candidatus Kentron sp. TC]
MLESSFRIFFERYAWGLSRHMTIQDAARHLGVSWDTIKDIQARYLQRRFAKQKLRNLKRIAIPSIYRRAPFGHRAAPPGVPLSGGS